MSARSVHCRIVIASFTLSLLVACTAPGVRTSFQDDARSDATTNTSFQEDAGSDAALDGPFPDGGDGVDAGVGNGGLNYAGPHPPNLQCGPTPGGVGAWQGERSMEYGWRRFGTVTVLQNGDLLVAGGNTWAQVPFCGAVVSGLPAEVYSAATGRWHTTGPMNVDRRHFTATRLLDGRVLVAGSLGQDYGEFGECSPLNSVEVYDPRTDRWTLVAPLRQGRFSHAATLLADGRVLVAGGAGAWKSVEVYDPAQDTWTDAAPMNTPLGNGAAALLLPSGQVIVAGVIWTFIAGVYQPQLATELYDPATGLWSDGPTTPTLGGDFLMFPLPSGRVMVDVRIERDSNNVEHLLADILDLTTGAFNPTPPLSRTRYYPAAALLSDGRVLLAGGEADPQGHSSGAADLFDEKTGEWIEAADMPHARNDLLLAPLGDDSALAIGGYQDEHCVQNNQDEEVTVYGPRPDRFLPHPSRPIRWP